MRKLPICLVVTAGVAALSPAPSAELKPRMPDNGAVARAYPMRNVSIDADLSDWPESQRFEIRWLPSGDSRPAASDLQASFRAGYDPASGRLFVAVEVVDDHHVVTGKSWDVRDSHILYVDPVHSPRGSSANVYAAYGSERKLLGREESWDPAVRAGTWDGCEVAVARRGRVTIYEWQIQIGDAARIGNVLGLDHLVRDIDEGDAANAGDMLFWGPYLGKSRGASRCGDLLLLGEQQPLGTLKGHIGWRSAREVGVPDRVRIVSSSNPACWLHVDADADGNYEAKLPPGMYSVSCPFKTVGDYEPEFERLAPGIAVDVVLSAGRVAQASPLELDVLPAPLMPSGDRGVLFEFRDERRAAIDRFVRTWMEYYQVPGVSLAVVADRKLVHHGVYGVKNFFTEEPVVAGTVFEAASITKPVFAFLVNSLAERGWIDLDRPLCEYLELPKVAVADPRAKEITARHCLTHRTGWPNWRRYTAGKLRTKFVPGTRHGYSGEGFEYLGRVVTKLYNQRSEGPDPLTLEQILQREVCTPLGFGERTYFRASPALRAAAAHGHFTTRVTASYLPEEVGVAHSMHTEARSLAKFMIALMRRDHLADSTYDLMLRPHGGHDTDRKYVGVEWPRYFGLGFLLMDTPHGWSVGHGGDNGDFKCEMECYPEHGVGFVVFTNSDNGAMLAHKLRDFLIGGGAEPSPGGVEGSRPVSVPGSTRRAGLDPARRSPRPGQLSPAGYCTTSRVPCDALNTLDPEQAVGFWKTNWSPTSAPRAR